MPAVQEDFGVGQTSLPPTAQPEIEATPTTSLLESTAAHIQALREQSRQRFPAVKCPNLTFSSIVKNSLDQEGNCPDSCLVQALLRDPRSLRGMPDPRVSIPSEWDALLIQSDPERKGMQSQDHDRVILRNVICHDIALAVSKQNEAERLILADGCTVVHAVPDGYLLRIWDACFGPINPKRQEARSYRVYHDHLDNGGVQFQYEDYASSLSPEVQAEIEAGKRNANDDPLADPSKPVAQRIYKKPYYVLEMDDPAFVQAWEGLVADCMIWLVKDRDGRKVGAYACFQDKVVGEGENAKLSFSTDIYYDALPATPG